MGWWGVRGGGVRGEDVGKWVVWALLINNGPEAFKMSIEYQITECK